MINSPKAFRKLVIKAEEQFSAGSLNGVALLLDEIDNLFPDMGKYRAISLCSCIEKIVQNRSGHLTFEDRLRCKVSFRLRDKIEEQKRRNEKKPSPFRKQLRAARKAQEIRKQDEAPAMGADSSLDKPSDFGDCDWRFNASLSDDGCVKVGNDVVCNRCHFEHLVEEGELVVCGQCNSTAYPKGGSCKDCDK